ncbi:hypothetical protein PS910_04385 [Pseudomonas fluorescens]|nr:hypothetical protein PS910_04385 [Pseudomonas fluorescens]
MTTARSTASARGIRTRSRRFKLGSRVSTCRDRLLQLFDRRRGLGSRLAQVGGAVGRIGAPLAVTAQVEQTAISQLKGHRAARACEDLLAREQAVAFDQYSLDAFRGYRYDLTNNAFDNRNNTAHLLSGYPVGFHTTIEKPLAMEYVQ